MKISNLKTADLVPYTRNAKKHDDGQVAKIAGSIREFGFNNPILVDGENTIIAGHGRFLAALKLELQTVPCIVLGHLTETQRKAFALADNRMQELGGGWDDEMLRLELQELEGLIDLDELGFGDFDLTDLDLEPEGGIGDAGNQQTLASRFLIPPFSVLNAREGWWQGRKRGWLALGICSELGRGENGRHAAPGGTGGKPKAKVYNPTDWIKEKELSGMAQDVAEGSGTSIFDPVLCELAYTWFCPPVGTVLDPFAGGSVRGVVASKLGRQYVGMELRSEQVEANREQAAEICQDPIPVWNTGDSRNIAKTCHDVDADFVFSCPPYADLEVYSDNPDDLSTMNYEDFKKAYFEIIAKSCERLKDNRFACFVVGEVRDKKGNYYNFVGDTVEAFKSAGLHFYNEAILVTSVGSLPIRVGRQFEAGRKLGKTHQNVLVFVKGDGKAATDACGPVEVFIPEQEGENSDLGEEL